MAIKTVSDSSQFPPMPPMVVVKIQSVRHHYLEREQMGGKTIGQFIDASLRESYQDGNIPNKLTIDLNPPADNSHSVD